ncbi:unnamed protein product [Vicia faba]|uniref:Uncharacterized protein n=1 Tax=Vicia faba TaxID=3906 RepID=A0AAV0YKB6_VICFA|nr:unnamed protein product [Vicia faba]
MASNKENSHDVSNNDGDEIVHDVQNEITRGITIMKSIIRVRDKGIKYDIHWNQENQLINSNDSMLVSYIGSLVRREILITYDNWGNRELRPAKDKIWSEIYVQYGMLFIFVDDYVFKLFILTHSMYVFFVEDF